MRETAEAASQLSAQVFLPFFQLSSAVTFGPWDVFQRKEKSASNRSSALGYNMALILHPLKSRERQPTGLCVLAYQGCSPQALLGVVFYAISISYTNI